MSFADLQSARKRKETKSFVSLRDAEKQSTEEAGGTGGSDAVVSAAQQKAHVTFDRPPGLPTSVAVRNSPLAGRGVFARVAVSPGEQSHLHLSRTT